jgi:VWFA-related protein
MSLRVTRALLRYGFVFALIFAARPAVAAAQNPAQPPAPPQQQPSAPQQPSQAPQPGYTISVTVPVVTVDVVATDNDGNYISGLKKENFRILEDGVPQIVSNFSTGDAPITLVMLLEFNSRGWGYYNYNSVTWAASFLNQMKPTDWIALESFSIKSQVELDFTHDRREVLQTLRSMVVPPAFTESDLFDALIDVVDRLRDVKGKKAVLVLATGLDTFSKLTLDKTLARLKDTDVTIFCVSVAEELAVRTFGGTDSLSYLQAQNQLKTFAALTGGRAWMPRFDGEIPGIMADVAGSLRNQYSLAYTPMNQNLDGKYRKLKVELVAPDGTPLLVDNAKGKKVKIQVYARQGYTAPKGDVN